MTRFSLFAIAAALCVAASTIPAQASAPSGLAGVLSGTVMTDRTERPLRNAQISIPKLDLAARSDSVGDFRITGVLAGTYEIVIRLDGFEPLRETINFSAGEKVAVDFLLSERVIQFTPRTTREKAAATVNLGRMGLEDRRGNGAGRFITSEEFTKVHGKTTTEIIVEKVHGLHAIKIGSNSRALASDDNSAKVEPSPDDKKSGAKPDCYVQVLLNGKLMYQNGNGNALFDVNSIPPELIISADFFTVSETPPEHRTDGARCGTLQIFTRGR